MTSIALSYSVLSVRQGVRDAAETFRSAGHDVRLVDQYDGQVFDDYGEDPVCVTPTGRARRTDDRRRTAVSATLTLRRETNVPMELRRGTFQITLDGATVATINRQQTFQTPIEQGRHRLQVWTGRYLSRPQTFDVADGGSATFRRNGADGCGMKKATTPRRLRVEHDRARL